MPEAGSVSASVELGVTAAGVRFPSLPRRGRGMGLDLPWGGPAGFAWDSARGDVLAPRLQTFLETHASRWSHAFFSWQPRDRSAPRLGDYRAAWDHLDAALPATLPRALHHTTLNLGALGPYRRSEILDFTNALCDRYRLEWVNEDVGLWSLAGRPLPYPLPPLMDAEGLRATVDNVRECQRALCVPLLLEFPGFARGVSVRLGHWDAYDFFRRLAEETGAPVTLDTGHLLSWQWFLGKRGEALFEGLERLPLDHCFEVHLSGCEIVADRFVDAHHGVLLDEQLRLLAMLVERCPNLRAVTFEDPRIEESGELVASSQHSWEQIGEVVKPWAQTG